MSMAFGEGWIVMPKLWWFFYFLSIGFFAPFLSVLMKDKGFTPQGIGFIMCARFVISLVGAPLLGLLVDTTGYVRLILTFSLCLGLTALSLTLYVSSMPLLILCFISFYTFICGHLPTLDRCTMGYIKRANKPNSYGHQRAWGPIAWGMAAVIAGKLQSLAGDYKWEFSILTGAVIGIMFNISIAASDMEVIQKEDSHRTSLRELQQVFTSRSMIMFFLVMMTIGCGFAVAETFLMLYLQELNAPDTLLGLTVMFSVSAEIPLFFFTSKLMEKIGVFGMLTLGVFSYALRFAGFCLLQDPWYVLLVEPLHGITYASFWTAGVTYVAEVAPKGLDTTAQGVLNGVTWGLGPLIGTLGGGVIYEHFGAVPLFATSGTAFMVMYMAFLVVERPWSSASPLSAGKNDKACLRDEMLPVDEAEIAVLPMLHDDSAMATEPADPAVADVCSP